MRTLLAIARTAAPALLLVVAGAARGQLDTVPMVVPVPDPVAEMVVSPLGAGAPGSDVFLYTLGGTGSFQIPWRGLLAGGAPGRAVDAQATDVAAGIVLPPDPSGRTDLVFSRPSGVAIAPASAPLVLQTLNLAGGAEETLAVARLLGRTEGVVVLPTGVGLGSGVPGTLRLWDLAGASPDGATVSIPGLVGRVTFHTEIWPLRLGDHALANGVDDLAIPGAGAVALAIQEAPVSAGVAGLDFDEVRAGDAVPQFQATWLPPGVSQGDVLGAAAVDFDLDGRPDLVFSLNVWTTPSLWTPGAVIGIHNTGVPTDFADATPGVWQDLTGTLGLQDPATLRPVDLGTARGAAVWDRAADQIVLFYSDGTALRTWRGPAQGLAIHEIVAGDVVGSPLPDLVALGFDWTTGQGYLLVFADLGDPPPALAWATGSPGVAQRGEDHPVTVTATDPQGPVALEWWRGPDPVPGATSPTLTLPGDSLCDMAPVDLRVRGTDTSGQFREITGTVTLVPGAPSVEAVGGGTPTAVLAPGGTQVELEGSIWQACPGAITYVGGGSGLPPGSTFTVDVSGPTALFTLGLPETTYPALLATPDPPRVTLSASQSGIQSDTTDVPVELDATGLVDVVQGADVASLGEGQLAVITARIESRIGEALPAVRVTARLDGLAPAGAPVVQGAGTTSATDVEVVLDALPPAGGPVLVQLPVRSGGQGGAAAFEVHAQGGWQLTPAAEPAAATVRLPGCGCGSGGGEGVLGLVLLVLLLRPAPLSLALFPRASPGGRGDD